jgi:transcriptional regulator
MLYIPPAFRDSDVPKLQDQMAASGLATLITVGAQGPLVSHLPLIFRNDPAPLGVLEGHISRGNPQWRDSDVSRQAVAMFMGPDAYVSPSWYASKKEHGRVVPTWNYSAVCASGTLEFFDDAELLRAQVTRLTDKFEGRYASPWQVSDAPADYLERQFKGIVGIRLRIEALEGKSKLRQNRPEADRMGVAAALREGAHEAERSVAALMDTPAG